MTLLKLQSLQLLSSLLTALNCDPKLIHHRRIFVQTLTKNPPGHNYESTH